MAGFTSYPVGNPIKLQNGNWGASFPTGEEIGIGTKVRIVTKNGKTWTAITHIPEGIRFMGKRRLQVWEILNDEKKESLKIEHENQEAKRVIDEEISNLAQKHIKGEISNEDFIKEYQRIQA